MTKVREFLKQYWVVLMAILLGGIFRIVFLSSLPTSLTGDELVYVLNAKLFFLGSDFLDGWNPLLAFIFHYPPGIFPQAELPYLISLLTSFSSSLFSIRLPYVVMSVGIIAILYFLGKELFEEKSARWIAFVAAVNPWFIIMGRTSYEMTPATLFYLLGIYILLKAKKTTWYVLSFLFFLLGFYSYIGTKLVFLPVILATCFYLYNKNKKQNKRLYVLYSIAALLVVMVSFLLLRLQPTTRLGEIYLPTNARIATQVIETRQATIPFLGESLLLNKLTVYGENVLEKTIASFSLDTLFSHGDMFLGISTHGLFYVIDLLFLLAGLVFVFRKEMRIGVFLVVLLVIGLIPQVLYKEVDLFTPHITFAIPIMVLVIGYGIAQSIEVFSYRKILTTILSLGYVYFVSQFLIMYFYQYPLTPQSDFPTRILSSYIERVDKDTLVTIYSNHKEDLYRKYLIYENKLNKNTLARVDVSLQKKEYVLGVIRFVSCDEKVKTEEQQGIIVIQSQCGKVDSQEPFHKISLLLDGGEVYRIYHDDVCSSDQLPSYPARNSLRLFSVENLTDSEYCRNLISK